MILICGLGMNIISPLLKLLGHSWTVSHFVLWQDSSFLVSSSIPVKVAAVELFGQVHSPSFIRWVGDNCDKKLGGLCGQGKFES